MCRNDTWVVVRADPWRIMWQVGGADMGSDHQQPADAETAAVIIRPPLLYLACLLLGLALERVLPLPLNLPETPLARWTAGGGLIVIGLAIMAAGISNFSRAATPVPSNQPVRALVTSGIHGWSRNPIYVGMSLLYAGIGIAAHSPWVLILGIPLLIILRYGVVAREETYLERRFGDAYRDYKARVRRWL
jgi:protein-S-isoprenylcysteine O-methyltransferase Ste14